MGIESVIRDPVYGHCESNSLNDEHKRIRESLAGKVDLTDPRLARIVRLRLVTDPGFPLYDLSYCWGQLRDGTYVRVDLPRWQFPKRGLKGALIEMCREAHVYAKGLGLLDEDVVSILA